LPSTVLSSLVVAELTARARTAKARDALEQQFLAPFERRGRILAPSAAAWRRTGTILGASATAPSASRLTDVLLASQAREFGWTIVTRDADFTALRRSITGLKVATPFPPRP
ncbi:MAG: type II toxin-antitoxin system VapC family toxin, partial [Gemmatimonadota bacterium]